MRLVINESIVLRNWESKDAKRLVMLANNEKIAKYMMDRFLILIPKMMPLIGSIIVLKKKKMYF